MTNTTDTGPDLPAATSDAVEPDAFVVRDRASRRRFIRTGAAFALAGGAALAATSRTALAADCDRNPEGCATQCSDSDSGEGSDPTGGGKRCSNISISSRTVDVVKVES